MQFHTILLAAAALFLPCAVSLTPIYGQSNTTSLNRYIVKVRPGVNISSICEATNTDTLYEYKVIHGFAAFQATLDEHQLRALRSEPNVEYIEKDMFASASAIVSQHDAPWGLARLSTRNRLIDQNPKYFLLLSWMCNTVDLTVQFSHINFTYTHDSSAGEGADIYVLDSGVYAEHVSIKIWDNTGIDGVTGRIRERACYLGPQLC
ncbi:hypothetical protein H0H93_005608 [Arthromyces matolae]|nr:hypothetical protein H0H93_005608 [Arthromyces matolae]